MEVAYSAFEVFEFVMSDSGAYCVKGAELQRVGEPLSAVNRLRLGHIRRRVHSTENVSHFKLYELQINYINLNMDLLRN